MRFLACLVLIFICGSAYAEATCSSAVSFLVEKEGGVSREIYFAELRVQGADEATTKAKLEAELAKAKAKSFERCKTEYENLSGCLQDKLTSAAGTLQGASFSARKALEEAFTTDCKKQQGVCKEAKSTEPKCVVVEPTVAADEKGGDKKGEKGKK